MPEHVIVTTCTNCHVFRVGHPEKHMKTCDVFNDDSQIFVECLASINCLTHWLLTHDIQEIKEIRASSNGTIPKWIKTQLHLEKSHQ